MKGRGSQGALQLLGPASRTSIMRLMAYPQGTAGSIMTTEFVQVPQDWTVARTLEHIRATEHEHETVYAIYAVDGRQHLQFVVSLRELVCAGSQLALTSLRRRPAIACGPYADREEVARIIRRHNFLALPVVGEDQRMVGIVTVDDVIDALMEEAQEDIGRFGGGGEHMGAPYCCRRRGRGWSSAAGVQ